MAGLKVRWLMQSQDFIRRRARVKDVEDEIIESVDPSWTALMFKELTRARQACCYMLETGVKKPDWVTFGRKTGNQLPISVKPRE